MLFSASVFSSAENKINQRYYILGLDMKVTPLPQTETSEAVVTLNLFAEVVNLKMRYSMLLYDKSGDHVSPGCSNSQGRLLCLPTMQTFLIL